MAYEVRLSRRAVINLRHIYKTIEAETSLAAERWFRGLELAIFSLEEQPATAAITQENPKVRHLLYGNKPHIYRIMFRIDEERRIVNIVQIRHGARRRL